MAGRRAYTGIPHRAWREPLRRGVALGVALSLHLALWMLVMRPAIWEQAAMVDQRSPHSVLRLRLLRRTVSLQAPAVMPAPRAVAVVAHTAVQRKPHPAQAPTPAQVAPASASPPAVPDTSTVTVDSRPATGDGGFGQRLRQAQHAYAIHGVPGSTVPRVAGIHLIDPKSQGISATMRQVQQLFGVANRHCIDVDAWRHLTPRELSARHISPNEVDRVDQEYQCNRPPGLSF